MLEWPALAAYPSQATRPATLQGGQQWRGVPPKGRPRAHYAQAPTASGSTSGGHLTPCHRVDSVDWTGGGGAGRPARGALSSADCWARGLSGCGFIRHPDFRPRPTDCQAARVLARFDLTSAISQRWSGHVFLCPPSFWREPGPQRPPAVPCVPQIVLSHEACPTSLRIATLTLEMQIPLVVGFLMAAPQR